MGLPPGTTGSTMPRRRLGRQLRDLRNRAGMTTRVAAQRLEWSEAKIWRIETGQTSLRGLDVEAMCMVYGAPAEVVAPLRALARDTKARGWWTAYNEAIGDGFDVYLGLEEAATRLAGYEDQLIPGLLQTESYTRALLRAARPQLTQIEIERRVRLRMARQALLTREPSAPCLDVVIDEAALRRRIGDATVVAGQLDRLLRADQLPNVRIRLLPSNTGYHPGSETGRFVLLEFAAAAAGQAPEPSVVYVEAFTGPQYLDKATDTTRYQQAFDDFDAVTVGIAEGVDRVRKG
ncbi:helix-turn-helix domain-containing protein [Nocardia donostiensis]|uniref:Transcriptional regulator n=1 Tax=Nocardia donostiensis TaxID=1538463 RepID=A0A1W0AVI4_9NOCA|nr:helix-turn-helix transcriptional regulator [Nocardia donostiensis]ONM46440.1 transcriptional regulator [Nocardia donostiensis]OQS14228.1 transcriptional regulator [Nocardia donostiensis]OQS17537.1 transcriptional regulator [Nocardia donostiensis]